DPDDDAARLVLADWLEEHGDDNDRERAAFVRFRVDAVPERGGTEFVLWPGRRWERGGGLWAPVHSRRHPTTCPRGLVSARLDPKLALGAPAAALAQSEEWAWVEDVVIDPTRSSLPDLLASPLLDPVAQVELVTRCDVGPLIE